MSYGPRATGAFPGTSGTSSIRQSIHPNSSTQQSSVLSARIESKKAELEELKQLRDVSSSLASQMEALEQKLSTLRDGTEGLDFSPDYVFHLVVVLFCSITNRYQSSRRMCYG